MFSQNAPGGLEASTAGVSAASLSIATTILSSEFSQPLIHLIGLKSGAAQKPLNASEQLV